MKHLSKIDDRDKSYCEQRPVFFYLRHSDCINCVREYLADATFRFSDNTETINIITAYLKSLQVKKDTKDLLDPI